MQQNVEMNGWRIVGMACVKWKGFLGKIKTAWEWMARTDACTRLECMYLNSLLSHS